MLGFPHHPKQRFVPTRVSSLSRTEISRNGSALSDSRIRNQIRSRSPCRARTPFSAPPVPSAEYSAADLRKPILARRSNDMMTSFDPLDLHAVSA